MGNIHIILANRHAYTLSFSFSAYHIKQYLSASHHSIDLQKLFGLQSMFFLCPPLYFYADMPLFIALRRYCVFHQVKVCSNPGLSKSFSTIFPTAFTHFMSLCHILAILTIFQTFSLVLYLSW